MTNKNGDTRRAIADGGVIFLLVLKEIRLHLRYKGSGQVWMRYFSHMPETDEVSRVFGHKIGGGKSLYCISGPNWEILSWFVGDLSHGHAQNQVRFDFQVKFYLKDQGQLPPKNNRDLNQGVLHLWFRFGDPSLNGSRVITRTSKWLTHRLTDTQTQATTIPKAKTGLWKQSLSLILESHIYPYFLSSSSSGYPNW